MDNPKDDQINGLDTGSGDSQDSDHQIPSVPQVDEGLPNEPQFEESVALPNVTAEEDASEGEPVDIDAQLESVGRDKNRN